MGAHQSEPSDVFRQKAVDVSAASGWVVGWVVGWVERIRGLV
ncbi:MAG: hypothetical protein QOE58_409, partial [Actinomycetota bacterium]|nr:hypothetical protein [Actinomycetota bacterium]